jgi:hypothetical protein
MSDQKTSPEAPAQPKLREDSDRLLQAVDELRALEREKRLQEVSSAPFHDLAQRVEDKAREVFRLAEQEEADGLGADAGSTIADSDPKG